jgi:hypothetical protein
MGGLCGYDQAFWATSINPRSAQETLAMLRRKMDEVVAVTALVSDRTERLWLRVHGR